jgi:NAD(P)-dependent dehydrogenase (short-subunit alcohol dehydrogenase family)
MTSTTVLITGTRYRNGVKLVVSVTYANEYVGANSGIGFATAKVLVCSSDAFHVIIGSRSLENAKAAQAEIEALNPKGSLSTVLLDVTIKASIEEAAEHIKQHYGQLDVLVNNAGVGGMSIEDVYTQFRYVLDTNVIGPAVVAAALRPLLLTSKNPYSIYVSSGARTLVRNALQKPPHFDHVRDGQHAYQVSKAALNMLAVLEARDYGNQGLKVFALSPGFVRSNLRGPSEEQKNGWGGAGDPDIAAGIVLDIVMGKRDEDVGKLVHKDGVYEW